MANGAERIWVAFPHNNMIIFARFENARFNPRYMPQEQLRNASYLESMSINDALEIGATLVVAGTAAARQLTETLKGVKIAEMRRDVQAAPLDPQALAKMAAQLDGIALDPAASVQNLLETLQQGQMPPMESIREEDEA